jgi:hypothetical protein
MQLILRRNQKSSMMGNVTFQLDVRADLTPEERGAISTYRLGKSVLYEKNTLVDKGSGLLGAASRLAFKLMNISVSVDDLVNRKHIDCKDIVEMLAVEDQIKEAAATFKQVLHAAANFGGEEAIAL